MSLLFFLACSTGPSAPPPTHAAEAAAERAWRIAQARGDAQLEYLAAA